MLLSTDRHWTFPFFFLSGNRGFAVTVALTCSGEQRCKDATTYSLLRRHLGLIKTMTKACACFYSGRSNLNLTVGAELGNSATPLGQSWTLMRMWGGRGPLYSSAEKTLHATASHWSGPICEGANLVDLHETWVFCRSMKCQALCLSLWHSLPLNANALVVVVNCSTVLM